MLNNRENLIIDLRLNGHLYYNNLVYWNFIIWKNIKESFTMRICHPNGVQGRRPISRKKDIKRNKALADLQHFLKQKPAK